MRRHSQDIIKLDIKIKGKVEVIILKIAEDIHEIKNRFNGIKRRYPFLT